MLKFIADDLGLHKSVNNGIIFLLKSGLIHGASLMVNGEAFVDAIGKIKDFNDKVGIHFVLVEEKSILSNKPLIKNHKLFFLKFCLGLIKMRSIEEELRTQINKLKEVGIKPAFINSHQHLHLLPGIMDVVIKIAKENDINYVRLVNEPLHGKGKLFRKIQLAFLNFLSKVARKKLKKAGLSYNDKFIGFLNAGGLTADDLEFAKKIKNGIVEIGCHPGYENEELRNKYKHWGKYNWEKELHLLSHND